MWRLFYGKKKESPQKAAMREMMRDYLKNNDISMKDGTDVNSIVCDMMFVLLEGALDEELNEELGYSKYDYRNKETANSRNGHSPKQCTAITEIWMWLYQWIITVIMNLS